MGISFNNLVSMVNNDTSTNLVIFITIALTAGYFVNKNYNAIILLYLVGIVMYSLSKNVLLSLGITIILTNILISMNMVSLQENLENQKKKKTKGIINNKMIDKK